MMYYFITEPEYNSFYKFVKLKSMAIHRVLRYYITTHNL